VIRPAAAPRFSRTRPDVPSDPPQPGEHTEELLTELGFAPSEIAELRSVGALASSR